MYCFSSGETLLAVQPLLLPPPAPIDSTLIDTPHTLAAILIGICALIGMFVLSIFRSSARLLSTFDRLTFTSEGTFDTPEATAEPALLTPSTADEAVLQADNGSSARSAADAMTIRIQFPLLASWQTRIRDDGFGAMQERPSRERNPRNPRRTAVGPSFFRARKARCYFGLRQLSTQS